MRRRVLALRGQCIKLNPLGLRGIPDRLVLLPGGVVLFVELKRPKGYKYEPLQLRWHDKLRKLGFTVLVINTKEAIEELVSTYAAKN